MTRFTSCLMVLGILANAMKAQITITQSDMPVPGQALVSHNDTAGPTGMVISAPGGNQVWNYTSGWSIGSTSNLVYQAPSSLNGAALFPTATVGINTTQNGLATNFFYRLTATAFEILGGTLSSSFATSTITFPNGNTAIQLPLSYGQSFSFTRRQVVINSYTIAGFYPLKISNTTTGTTSCDAWGSLTTPAGTAEVLRVKTNIISELDSQFVDSTNTGNNWEFSSTSSGAPPYSSYAYYRNGTPSVILNLNADNSSGAVDLSSYSSFTPTGIADIEQGAPMFFPNPAANWLSLINENPENVLVRITDLSGKIVHRCHISGVNIVQINTEGLNAGLYLVEVCNANGAVTQSGKCMVQR